MLASTLRAAPVILLICASGGAPALAEMPRYDVEGFCKGVAAVGGSPSQMMLNACLRQEQTAYDRLKPSWDALPATMKAYCDGVARVGGGGSFEMLDACIRQEQNAARENGEFKFQR